MPPKFFKNPPQPGKPLSIKGLARALNAIAKALETMDCLGGYVDWSHGRPTIVPPSSSPNGDKQLDHSFLPVKTSDTQFSITQGRVYVGKEANETLPTTTTGLAIGTDYYIKANWSVDFLAPTIEWTSIAGVNNDLTRYYPIIKFTSTTWDSLIRKQTSDLHVPNYPIPAIGSTASGAVLLWNYTTGKLEWKFAPTTGNHALTVSNGAFGWTELTTFECPP